MRPCACQPVLVPCSFFLLPDFTSGLLWLTELALLPLQTQRRASRRPAERLHLDHPAITECVDIRKAYILPMVATFGTNPGVNKYDDPVASHDKPLRCLPRPQRHGAASDTVSRHLAHDTCRGEGTPPARSTRCAPRAVRLR